ncbi:hypothetical protein BJ138DRAFT_1096025 [Hygrophoropsis aurantiaca]|uniref:Uncharacterized protein n=1 Tax=Hygrophoropsis aurantiaca TaxID=72124 RepID=A0ACB7ZST4_9AGAM|nr:hypothetical protein BJ138DRAFT_1096025 [Hygrophoropsis aurantiaca]
MVASSEIESVIQQLQNTTLSELVSANPLTSETHLKHNTARFISPIKKSQSTSHDVQPKTANEVLLLASLRNADAANASLKQRVLELQAANILNEMYCTVLRGQLANYEEKKKKGKGKGKLMGDGLPRFLSGDEFYERVVEFEQDQRRVSEEKRTRKEDREKRAGAIAEWKRLEDKRKTENQDRRTRYRATLETWTAAKARAKAEKQKFDEPKPLLGKLIPAIPRPKISTYDDERAGSSGEEEFNLDEGTDASDEE